LGKPFTSWTQLVKLSLLKRSQQLPLSPLPPLLQSQPPLLLPQLPQKKSL
jgi:hypothetical protein